MCGCVRSTEPEEIPILRAQPAGQVFSTRLLTVSQNSRQGKRSRDKGDAEEEEERDDGGLSLYFLPTMMGLGVMV